MEECILFLKSCQGAAIQAGQQFKMNPKMILAQAALESGWGSSELAREHRNFFGLMAYGASNAYWHGKRAEMESSSYYGMHLFRHYDSVEHSFLDFARLISSAYRRAWSFSFQPEAYAKEIAYSPYISELNGDNRDLYRRSLVSLEQKISLGLALMEI